MPMDLNRWPGTSKGIEEVKVFLGTSNTALPYLLIKLWMPQCICQIKEVKGFVGASNVKLTPAWCPVHGYHLWCG